MKPILTILIIALVGTGCATSPFSSAELQKRIDADLLNQNNLTKDLSQGRPIFVEVHSYPQLLPSGDLWLGGKILVNVGREQINYTDFVKKHQTESAKTKAKKNGSNK